MCNVNALFGIYVLNSPDCKRIWLLASLVQILTIVLAS